MWYEELKLNLKSTAHTFDITFYILKENLN